jgi:peptidoglycan/xylan/chitin deacetylase (PgdA/CDA1 family)
MAARYLVRFDDLCPTTNWAVWDQVESLLNAANIRPLVAVVPANCDPLLEAGPADSRFWSRVRGWQQRGWAIGLHGFEHRYVTASAGIVGRNNYSEFAGLSEAEQERKLRRALDIFESNRVHPDAWIAPAHSFDETTVRVLAKLGLGCISDGYALKPYLGSDDMFWVPQQLGRFRAMPAGVWTVCLHINAWTAADIEGFRADVVRFGPATASLVELRRLHARRRQSLADRLFSAAFKIARKVGRTSTSAPDVQVPLSSSPARDRKGAAAGSVSPRKGPKEAKRRQRKAARPARRQEARTR